MAEPSVVRGLARTGRWPGEVVTSPSTESATRSRPRGGAGLGGPDGVPSRGRASDRVRPTNDIDLVVDLRIEPTVLGHTHDVLAAAGFSQDLPSPEGVAHRYRRGGATIDVLAPDHLGARAKLSLGSGRTIEAPGTSQAFGRVSLVRVELDDETAGIVRRPTLVGALLGKATAVTEIVSMSSAERAKHVRDVDALARLLGPADRAGASLTTKERATLDRVAEHPDISPLAARSIQLTASTHD